MQRIEIIQKIGRRKKLAKIRQFFFFIYINLSPWEGKNVVFSLKGSICFSQQPNIYRLTRKTLLLNCFLEQKILPTRKIGVFFLIDFLIFWAINTQADRKIRLFSANLLFYFFVEPTTDLVYPHPHQLFPSHIRQLVFLVFWVLLKACWRPNKKSYKTHYTQKVHFF